MTCEEAAERLPEDSSELSRHLEGCPSCRELQEAYDLDGERLAAGLRALTGRAELGATVAARLEDRPSPRRRIVPLAAAAAMLAGVLAVVLAPPGGETPSVGPRPAPGRLEKPALLVLHGDEEEDLQLIPTDHVVWAQVVGIGGNRMVSVSAGSEDGVAPGQKLTVFRRASGGYGEIGTLHVLEAGASEASGRVLVATDPPRVGDTVVSGQPLTDAEKRAVLERVFSFRLRGGNGPGPYDHLIRSAGLEHDVEFLARLKDPRAYDRLARILEAVAPFAREGFPPRAPDLAERMHAWWAEAQYRVRWNAPADRYEE